MEVQRKLLIAIQLPAHSQTIHVARENRQKVQAKEEPLFAHEWNKEKEKGKIYLRIIKLEFEILL